MAIRVGNHLYEMCGMCHHYVKLTGLFKGLHLCVR